MSHDFKDTCDPYVLLAEIDDIEERARFRREWGLLEDDEDGHRGFCRSTGTGEQTMLNQAVVGYDLESYLGGLLEREDLVAAALRREECARADKARSAEYLSWSDLQTAYRAASFLPQERGLYFNAFITIAYEPLGLSDPNAMTRLLTDFLDEAGDQVERWGYEWHTLYVHEHSAERGLHTHIVATIHPNVRHCFEDWARDGGHSFFWRRCRVTSPTAVDIKIKAPETPLSKARWHWDRVQYMTKGLDPELTARCVSDGRVRPLYELIGLRERYRNRKAGVTPFKQRVGTSRSIGSGAQQQARDEGMPMLSALDDRAWPHLHLDHPSLDWELKEHKARDAERQRRKEALSVDFDDDDMMKAVRRAREIGEIPDYPEPVPEDMKITLMRRVRAARVIANACRHPYTWDRTWSGWWYTLPEAERWGGRNVKRGLKALQSEQSEY
ncbi:hypothetical protein [Microvirga pakistanensis]|uniref:hypothetical protein n=1 Tax=Microvirga pakistanensis TaxID=1682650 RepID=UPI00106D718C|nr:hypothetical protein [Microvirga pakistanensis]